MANDIKSQCPFCKGEMEITEKPKYNNILTAVIIILGVLSLISISGAIIGCLFLVIGLVMAFSKKEIWLCESCMASIDRFAKPKGKATRLSTRDAK